MHVKYSDILTEAHFDTIHNPYDVDAPLKKDLVGINQYWYYKSDIIVKNGKKTVKPGAIPDYITGKDGHLHRFSPKEREEFKRKQSEKDGTGPDVNPVIKSPSNTVATAMNAQVQAAVQSFTDTYKNDSLHSFPKDFAILGKLQGAQRTKAANYIISKYDITTDSGRKKLFFGKLPPGLQRQFTDGGLGKYVIDTFQNADAIIGINDQTTSSVVVDGISLKEFFKPTIIFNRKLRKVLDISSEHNMDGSLKILRIEEFTYFPEKIPDVRDLFLQYRQMYSAASDYDIHCKVQRIINNILAYNQKLKLLSTFERFDVIDFTKMAGNSVNEKLGQSLINQFNLLVSHQILTPNEFAAIDTLIKSIIRSPTLSDFNQHVAEFIQLVSKTNARETLSSVLEILSAIRQSIANYNIYIPMKDDFRLADIICLLPSHFNITTELEKYETIELIITSIDVKFLSGAASSMRERINYSLFNHKHVRKDLYYLTEECFSSIFSDDEIVRQTVHDKIDDILHNTINRNAIISYYQFDIVNLNKIAQIDYIKENLLYGLRPRAGQPAESKATIFNQDITNGASWELYSLVGFLAEALYNSMVDMQLFESHTYSAQGIKVTDGYKVLSKLRFKFVRKLKTTWPPIPDGPPSARIIPMSRDEIRIN